jgi:drug/metabolite transporter (DMT)-like permease
MTVMLALSAAFCWGVADFMAGTEARRTSAFVVALAIQATGMVCLTALVAGRGIGPPSPELIAIGILTGLASGLAFLGIYATLAMGYMARVAPVFTTAAVIPVLVGLAGGDDPSQLQLTGMAAAMVGVTLISAGGSAQAAGVDSRAHFVMGLAVLTAASAGFTLVGLDHVATYDPYWAVLLLRVSGVFLLGIAVLAVRKRIQVRRAQLRPLVAIGLLDAAANVFWSIASTEELLSVVAVLGALFPTVTVVLALVILREPLNRTQAPGVALTLAGSAMIAGG